jgi:hypothetical protein
MTRLKNAAKLARPMERSDTRNTKYHEVFGNVREIKYHDVPHRLKRNSKREELLYK